MATDPLLAYIAKHSIGLTFPLITKSTSHRTYNGFKKEQAFRKRYGWKLLSLLVGGKRLKAIWEPIHYGISQSSSST